MLQRTAELLAEANDLVATPAGLVDLDNSFVFMLALFLVLFAILNKTFLQPMLKMFDQRHALTQGAQEEAARSVADAETKIAEYTSRVGEARRTAQLEQKALRTDALEAARTLLDGVRAEEEAKLDTAIEQLNQTADKARTDLEASAQHLGKQVATRLLGGGA